MCEILMNATHPQCSATRLEDRCTKMHSHALMQAHYFHYFELDMDYEVSLCSAVTQGLRQGRLTYFGAVPVHLHHLSLNLQHQQAAVSTQASSKGYLCECNAIMKA